jgi:hypothetical protein
MAANELGSMIGGLFVILVLGAAASAASRRGVSIPFPALVLQQFNINPMRADGLVTLVGRPEGIVGWFLHAIGIDTTTTLLITNEYVYITRSSLSGQIRQTAPMHNIASTHCGYATNLIWIILAVAAPIGGFAITMGAGAFWPFLFSVALSLCFVLLFYLSKKLMIAFETNGGLVLGVTFKKGIIENVPVDIEHVTQVITLFNQQLRRGSPQPAPVAGGYQFQAAPR